MEETERRNDGRQGNVREGMDGWMVGREGCREVELWREVTGRREWLEGRLLLLTATRCHMWP